MFSNCAYKKTAIISEGKKEEPISTQPYLSISHLKNFDLLVPFSLIISALSRSKGLFTTNKPPSPLIIFLVSWKEKVDKSP